MLKYIWREKKNTIILISIILLCSIAIALGIYAQITNTKISHSKEEKQEQNYTELKNNFKSIFTNSVNKESTANSDINPDEILYVAYDIQEKDSGKYDINAKIPLFKISTNTTKKINKEITKTFAQKIASIVKNNSANTIYSLDYVAYINSNILSFIIRCTLKEGSNPQRIIIQTYNYDLDNDKLLAIDDILNFKNLDKQIVQDKINSEIKTISEQTSNIEYNVYQRDYTDNIYLLKNTQNFFLGKDGLLYIVYAYGNTNYTSTMDLIIF